MPGVDGPTVTVALVRNWVEIPLGVLGRERSTVPENPPMLVTVIVDTCDDPLVKVRLEGPGETLKPCTLNVPFMKE